MLTGAHKVKRLGRWQSCWARHTDGTGLWRTVRFFFFFKRVRAISGVLYPSFFLWDRWGAVVPISPTRGRHRLHLVCSYTAGTAECSVVSQKGKQVQLRAWTGQSFWINFIYNVLFYWKNIYKLNYTDCMFPVRKLTPVCSVVMFNTVIFVCPQTFGLFLFIL